MNCAHYFSETNNLEHRIQKQHNLSSGFNNIAS